jgi:hypothetical protein
MLQPNDTGINRWPTIAHLAWGRDALYVAVEALDPEPEKINHNRHRRDDLTLDRDFIGLDVDSFSQGQSAIRLLVTSSGGQCDAMFKDSGEDYTYDCLWDSVCIPLNHGYLVKYRVPYGSLRQTPGDWHIRIFRLIPRERRYEVVWPPMSKDIQCDLCQAATLTGAPVLKSSSPFLVVPFASAERVQNREIDPSNPPDNSQRLGIDLRYSSTAATLEGTYRPDFNNVDADVDPVSINSRYKVLYSEQRPFFLEGMDILNVSGAQRQFYSRSISDPLYGLKVSGNSSRLNWCLLHAKDDDGGAIIDEFNIYRRAALSKGLATQDTAAGIRLGLDGRSSNLEVLGTRKSLLGGPLGAGGSSGGIYLSQYLGRGFQLYLSHISASAKLPQSTGTNGSFTGSAGSVELDWSNRNWFFYAWENLTSPNLVMVSGFTDLQGYRSVHLKGGWRQYWNTGPFSNAGISFNSRNLHYWNGNHLEQGLYFAAFVETVNRLTLQVDGDVIGRTWAYDQVTSTATRYLEFSGSWKQLQSFQPYLVFGGGRTIDLNTGTPARNNWIKIGSNGHLSNLVYNFELKQSTENRESDSTTLNRGRRASCSFTWQFPLDLSLHCQAFGIRYDGSESASCDKFLKIFLGWQPNAFTSAYIGWSGKRRWDPADGYEVESLVERKLFAKLAYAWQF